MEDGIRQFVKQCPNYQRFKKKKYDKFPLMNIELIHWDTVCIDLLVGPYIVTGQKGNGKIAIHRDVCGSSHMLG